MASRDDLPPGQDSNSSYRTQSPRIAMSSSAAVPQRLRNDESWVEISSQPSSSSLSSIGDEIVTTGLRVQHSSDPRRPRRRVQAGIVPHTLPDARQTNSSSQEEYEESESDEEPAMTSSNEHIMPPTQTSNLITHGYNAASDSEDDENATALGRPTEPLFTPQPNAFSHPPSSLRPMAPDSYFPRSSQPLPTRPSYTNRSRTQRSSHNQADHDAALRASLTTLLSIGAAAARGLPKRDQGNSTMASNEPMNLRLVPESELMAGAPNASSSSSPLSPSIRPRSSPSISSQEVVDKGKRKATAAKPSGEKARIAKKKKVQIVEEAMISPTLLTWVMSAGVVVLVSVVGFGAGYVIGREVGKQEAFSTLNSSALVDGGSCSREAVRGSGSLRRFRWGTAVARNIAA